MTTDLGAIWVRYQLAQHRVQVNPWLNQGGKNARMRDAKDIYDREIKEHHVKRKLEGHPKLHPDSTDGQDSYTLP